MWFFGCSYGQFEYIHTLLDHPWVEIFGAEHRRLMHDEAAVKWIENNYGPVAGLVARGHIAIDIAVTSMKNRGLKR